MKILMIALIGVLGFTTTYAQVNTKKVDLTQSTVEWEGHKVIGDHQGTINVKEGNFDFDQGVLTGGEIIIDMNTIDVLDLSGSKENKLKSYLTSENFFSIQDHPTASFIITNVTSTGNADEYTLEGNLTIKGNTKNITVDVTANETSATASLKVNRTEFKVQAQSFFAKVADNTIYDEFDLKLNLVLK